MNKQIKTYTSHIQSGILLNANESSVNLDADIIQEIQQAIPTIAFHRYPDNTQDEIRHAYANLIHLKKENVLAGNGSDQMIGLMIGTYLAKGKKLYTFDPDFSMYDYYASCYEASVEKFALDDDGKLNVDAFIQNGITKEVSCIIFSRPNNPTGSCLTISEIQKIVEAFHTIPVIVDEAYIEFTTLESAITLLDTYSNLYVTRTLSKAYALAGIRLGFLMSQENNIKQMEKRNVVYALNSVSMKIGTIVLRYASRFQENAKQIQVRREAMYQTMQMMKSLRVFPSHANFLYIKTDYQDTLLHMFQQNNIVIRTYADAMRITVGTEAENKAVLKVLKQFEETICA